MTLWKRQNHRDRKPPLDQQCLETGREGRGLTAKGQEKTVLIMVEVNDCAQIQFKVRIQLKSENFTIFNLYLEKPGSQKKKN